MILAVLNPTTRTVMLYRGVDPLTAPTDDISFLMDTLGPATPAAEQLMASIWAFLYPHAATVALP